MINKIDSTSFQSRFHMNGFSKHTPKERPYKEFYFMPELQHKNPFVEMFKKFGNTIREILGINKSKNLKHFDNAQNIKGTTIEI